MSSSAGTAWSPSNRERLRNEMQRRDTEPFLVTVTPERRPHCGTVTVNWDASGEQLVVAPPPSRWDLAEAAGCAQVSVLWPPSEPGAYTLIVDGTAAAAHHGGKPTLRLSISRAVLFRRDTASAVTDATTHAASSDDSCHSDCIPLG